MAKEQTGKPKEQTDNDELVRVKVIAKNQKLSKLRGDKRVISVKYNHVGYKIPEGEEIELPAGVITMLKGHITKAIVPTGDRGVVKGKNFKTQIFNSFEIVEL